ncbi:hypothetical protein G7054_g10335 [Neopestalotiopsis clavispora]|nr:hypothetical protein G7054_g10335 [Neopestalotiopsis clavispora]
MQRLGHPRMLGRRWATAPQPIFQIIRHVGRKSWRGRDPTLGDPDVSTYNVNRLLLDLDAENVEHVRRYDPDIDGMPEDRYAKRNREKAVADARISNFFHDTHATFQNFKDTIQDRAVEWYINDLDIISTVLRGEVNNSLSMAREPPDAKIRHSGQDRNNTLYGISGEGMRRNGIPQGANRSKLISYMLRRQKQTTQSGSTRLMTDMTWESDSITEIKRPLIFLANTSFGSQLVSKQSRFLGETCSRVLEECKDVTDMDRPAALELLMLCNDLVMRLLKEDLPIDQHLWCLGFELAVRFSVFPAARMYLEAGSRFGKQNLHGENFLLRLLKAILNSVESSQQGAVHLDSASSPSGHNAAIFGLLTGQDLGGHQSPVSVQSMIDPAQPSDSAVCHTYMHILGELGAVRTLWHTFQELPRIVRARHSGPGQGVPEMDQLYDQFVHAFLRIAQNVKNDRISIRDMRLAETTGSYVDDCKLDLQAIFRVSDSNADSSAKLPGFPRTSTSFAMKKAILEAFRITDIAVSMKAIQRLIEAAAKAGTGMRTI